MQSLYKIIKSPGTSGNEVISLPDIRLMHEKKEQKKNDLNNDNSSEINDEIILRANQQAEMIVKNAEASAKKLLMDTNEAANKLLLEAKDNGYQQGYKQGYNDGYGFGINEANAEADEIRKKADTYIESCMAETETYIKNKQEEVIQLSITIAKQIIHSEILMNQDIVNKIAEDVLSKAADRKHVILKVNPIDFNVLKNKKEDLSIYVENPNNLFIIADSSVTQGSVKAETASGFIDGDIETQLDMITKLLKRN